MKAALSFIILLFSFMIFMMWYQHREPDLKNKLPFTEGKYYQRITQNETFLIPLDSLQILPFTGDSLRFKVWGIIGNDICYRLSHLNIQRTDENTTISIFGEHDEQPVCSKVLVTLAGKQIAISGPFPTENFQVVFKQPEGKELIREISREF